MNLIFDSHAHYDDHAFYKDREEILSGLLKNGVDKVMNISAKLEDIEKVVSLANNYDFIWASVGVHPSEIYELKKEDLKVVSDALSNSKVKAIGEIGLDYHYDDTDKIKQADWFEMQIELAKKNNLPIVVHSREAAADTLDIIKQTHADSVGGVIHCFSYEKEMAKIYLDMGFYIGVGGVVTYKNARKLKEVVKYMPMEKMLLETDCPYLAPTPHRGERNDSSMIKFVVSEISGLKGMDEDYIRKVTNENAQRLYKI